MRTVLLTAALAVTLAWAPSFACAGEPLATTSAPTAATDAAPAPAADDVICKMERMTGSHIPNQRVCKTRAEWDGTAAGNADLRSNPAVSVHAGSGMANEGAAHPAGRN